jgi:hypothetical protein
MAATVATRTPGYEDSIQCNNNRTLAYLLKSTDGVNWSRADGYGLLNLAGIVWPTLTDGTWQTVHGPWLVNISIAYDPATQYVYMTRAYASNTTCSNSPGSYPDRVQVYRTRNTQPSCKGACAMLYVGWDLLIDIGCNSSYSYQQPLNIAPDAAQIRHDGLGNVLYNSWGGITLVVSSSEVSCGINAPVGVYKIEIAP